MFLHPSARAPTLMISKWVFLTSMTTWNLQAAMKLRGSSTMPSAKP